MTGFILAVAAGAAVGVAIGYFLNSDGKDQIIDNVKEKTAKLKHKAENLKSKIKDKMHHINDPIDEVAAG